MVIIKKITDIHSHEANQLFKIRTKVFVEEQNVDHRLEYDRHEKESNHYLAYFDSYPCGAARWRVTENGIKLERFAVLGAYRSKGIGLALLNEILSEVIPANQRIYLHSQITSAGFYLKNGFVEEGEHFWEANIEHVLMVYQPQAAV